MGSSTRHISTYWSRRVNEAVARARKGEWPGNYHAACIRATMENGVVHQPVRIAPRVTRSERIEPGPVADKRPGAPVGERMASDSLVEVQRKGGLPNQSRRS